MQHHVQQKKGLYGLKQSGRLWYQKLGEVLESMGFKRLVSDPSIYVWEMDGIKVIVPVFVDDLTIVSKDKEKVRLLKEKLSQHFKIRDLGPISFLLGVHITRDRASRSLSLSQKQYSHLHGLFPFPFIPMLFLFPCTLEYALVVL